LFNTNSFAPGAFLFTGNSSGFQVYSVVKRLLDVVETKEPPTKPKGGNAHGRHNDNPARKYMEMQQLRKYHHTDGAAANLPRL